ncbi:hypothetical protein AB0I30_07435 [Nocardia tengchongensis]|uniref:hypothetical protein n=1 Tax=Nocardia tengchongensis TaxID=2055889 RepID=UPI0033E49FAF
MGRLWPLLAITTCTLLTACGPGDTVADSQAPASTSTPAVGKTTTKPATTSTKQVAVADLPKCGDIQGAGAMPNDPLPDCRLSSGDSAALSFIVRHQAGHGGNSWTAIEVTGSDGKVLQTLDVRDTEIPAEPYLADLDVDGRDELIVPVSTAIVGNSTYVVFRPKADKLEFVEAGKVFGIGVDRTASGYIAAMSKSGPADKYIEFQKFVGSKLVFVAEIIQTFDKDGHSTCRVDGEKGVPESEFSDEEVVRRFCGEQLLRTSPVG